MFLPVYTHTGVVCLCPKQFPCAHTHTHTHKIKSLARQPNESSQQNRRLPSLYPWENCLKRICGPWHMAWDPHVWTSWACFYHRWCYMLLLAYVCACGCSLKLYVKGRRISGSARTTPSRRANAGSIRRLILDGRKTLAFRWLKLNVCSNLLLYI